MKGNVLKSGILFVVNDFEKFTKIGQNHLLWYSPPFFIDFFGNCGLTFVNSGLGQNYLNNRRSTPTGLILKTMVFFPISRDGLSYHTSEGKSLLIYWNINVMKNKIIYIIIALLGMVVLTGCVLLIRKKQSTPKMSYFAKTKLLIEPKLIEGKTKDQISIQLVAETESGAKISSIDTQICFGNELEISETDTSSLVELNQEVLGILVDASVDKSKKCLRLIAIANLNMKPTDLATGTVRLATIKLLAKTTGSGEIKIDGVKTKVGGYNPTPGAANSAIKVTELGNAKYVISE